MRCQETWTSRAHGQRLAGTAERSADRNHRLMDRFPLSRDFSSVVYRMLGPVLWWHGPSHPPYVCMRVCPPTCMYECTYKCGKVAASALAHARQGVRGGTRARIYIILPVGGCNLNLGMAFRTRERAFGARIPHCRCIPHFRSEDCRTPPRNLVRFYRVIANCRSEASTSGSTAGCEPFVPPL